MERRASYSMVGGPKAYTFHMASTSPLSTPAPPSSPLSPPPSAPPSLGPCAPSPAAHHLLAAPWEPPSRCAGAVPVGWQPTRVEVVAAVRSLYKDALKPYGRLILKRVRELAAVEYCVDEEDESSSGVPRVDPRLLRRIALNTPGLQVEPEDGKEYSVHLVKTPATFVDVSSSEDPYPEELWARVAEYFDSLSSEDMVLPGGRYACAKLLAGRRPAFLEGRSLGEICRIIQLAISQRRILGYADGHIVPYGKSEERMKEECAVLQQPVSSPKQRGWSLPHATWEQARLGLVEILQSPHVCAAAHSQHGFDPPSGVAPAVTLSNVKRLFRSRFRLELSETVLGYPRLLDLLSDYRFSDICTVQPHSNGQVVVHSVSADLHGAPPPSPPRSRRGGAAAAAGGGGHRHGSETPDSMASVSTPSSVGTAWEAGISTPTSQSSPSCAGCSPGAAIAAAVWEGYSTAASGSVSPVRGASGHPAAPPLPAFLGSKPSDLVCLSTCPLQQQQQLPPPQQPQQHMAQPASPSPPTPPPVTPAPTIVSSAEPPPPAPSTPDAGVMPRPSSAGAEAARPPAPTRWEFVAAPSTGAAPKVLTEEEENPYDNSGCWTPRPEPGLPEHLCQAEALQRVSAALEQWRSHPNFHMRVCAS